MAVIGSQLVVCEYTEVLDEGTISFPGGELVGLHERRLGEEPCNLQKDGRFIVLRTGPAAATALAGQALGRGAARDRLAAVGGASARAGAAIVGARI